MTSCSVFQQIMAGLDLTYKMGFTERLHFTGPTLWRENGFF
jgi:hypothetical protein